ncbi:hypothetical protein [Olleya marilimosa]|uniref:hypothetical protein n=1 Tax=Olleya marilimosa TaxID=272164 RepID=UPI0030EE3D53|tara:strand:+ start:846 stop:1256 length:411 start_codon:yes stop_codon:yes gene_type:complete
MLQIRPTTIKDYKELCDWWQWHRFPKPPVELLDYLKYGLMVHSADQNICAGFLYFTNARQFGLLEYVVSTYKVKDKIVRKEALKVLILGLQKVAKNNGVEVLFSSLRNEPLIKTYQDCGFVIGSKNTTEMICKLQY